ncbi:MAG TPA: 2OG-Fe(II) oxygenase [Burkholderiales bacterium]|nr:2OG-Fe(II) oxygenase [Burkholderiales bacterium]
MLEIPAFYFDSKRLERLLHDHRGSERFRGANPFPHLVIDDFLPREVIERLIAEFPDEDAIEWIAWGPGRTSQLAKTKLNKLGQSDERCFPPFIRHFIGQLLSATFVEFVEALSGIKGLIVDPSHNGCGLHSTGHGGRLMIHTDVNRHPHSRRNLHQVLNLILYLNEDWKDEYNGHLELWTRDRKPSKKILPSANRAVLFETGTRSFHGHPQPLNCPPGRRRNSIAVYYYCFDRLPADEYEGMQRFVHWVPTSEEDRRIGADSAALAETTSMRLRGATALVPAEILPVDIANLGERKQAHLTIAHESSLDAGLRQKLRESRVAPMFPDIPSELGRYFILGYLSAAEGAAIGDDGCQLVVCARDDGALYLENPRTGRALFYGYVEMIGGLLPDAARR